MLDLRIKKLFFDRAKVKRAVDRATLKALGQAGGSVRLTARRSIRKRPYPSSPGDPPHSHEGSLRRLILYGLEPTAQQVVVGPVKFKAGQAPKVLEFGGSVRGVRNARRRIRRIGEVGEIRARTGMTFARRDSGKSKGRRKPKRSDVTYAVLKTPAQVDRANQLNEQLYGPGTITGKIDARPFMGPALEKERPKLPKRWANSVQGG